MKAEDLQEANELTEKIEEIDYFLETVNPKYNIMRGSGRKDINAFIKIKASRWFGFGTHISEIEVPFNLITELYKMAKIKKDRLTKELDTILNKRS